ncbi:MAG: tRNA uridine-5-carboxymethylaminomethyl(34) synthesis GTPase MnmE [Candidatus Brocadiales bacterium]
MNTPNDTILAVSTAWGNSPRTIIRISGPDALSCAKKVFTEDLLPMSTPGTYCSLKGRIDLGDQVAAPAFLYIMEAPRSYTREDVVEIHSLGSPPLIEMLMEKILRGAHTAGTSLRLAEPGEFTKRAFLNGRIDIVQAEAVLRVIRSRTDAELRLAAGQLEGRFSQGLRGVHERITNLLSLLEASIDFSDQDIRPISEKEALDELEVIRETLLEYTHRSDKSKVHSGGIRTVFFGPSNAGKSSLFNALLGRPRAITSHKSGTTRDYLEAELIMDGITFRLLDTAGLVQIKTQGDEKSLLETLTMDMTAKAVNTASLSIWVLDGSRPVEKPSLHFLQSFHQPPSDSSCILVINKTDLPLKLSIEDLPPPWQNFSIIYTSTVTGSGIEELKKEMVEKITEGCIDCSASPALLNTRQGILLDSCLDSLERASQSLKEEASAEFVALDVMDASDALGELLGKITTEDILEKIFSQFCIGK